MIIMAQVIVAVQMVLEEKFVYKHDVHPLKAVGTEGKANPFHCTQTQPFYLLLLDFKREVADRTKIEEIHTRLPCYNALKTS